jgi:hypothetical protein
LKKEEATLRATLAVNRYSPKFINKVLNQSQKQNPTNQETTKGTVVVPYIQGYQKTFAELGKNSEYV